MRPPHALKLAYRGKAELGARLPLPAFRPWLAQHGLDVPLLLQALLGNRGSTLFAWDVIISAIVVIVATVSKREASPNARKAIVIVATRFVGVSLGLPLLLFFKGRARAVAVR